LDLFKGVAGSVSPRSKNITMEDEKQWYVIHTQSGYENKVKTNLEQRIKSMDVGDKVFQVMVPTEDEIQVRDGRRCTVTKKVFPGYVLVQMKMTDQSWGVVRNTPGVTGFVGTRDNPSPLSEEEVQTVLGRMEAKPPRVKVGFSKGEGVRIIDGPFIDFIGVVDSINTEKGKVRVLVSFFGRETPVELDLLQVERL
jgi:transcriptional antiterminator NusG